MAKSTRMSSSSKPSHYSHSSGGSGGGGGPPPQMVPVPHRSTWELHATRLLESLGRIGEAEDGAAEPTMSRRRKSKAIRRTVIALERRQERQKKSKSSGVAGEALAFYRYVLDKAREGEGRKKRVRGDGSEEDDSAVSSSSSDDEDTDEADEEDDGSGEDDNSNDNDDDDGKESKSSEEDEDEEWMDQHNDMCEVCSMPGELLCCSTCNLVFHQACHRPVLKVEPPDNWSCAYCDASGVTALKKDSRPRRRAAQGVREMARMQPQTDAEEKRRAVQGGQTNEKEPERKPEPERMPETEQNSEPKKTQASENLDTACARSDADGSVDPGDDGKMGVDQLRIHSISQVEEHFVAWKRRRLIGTKPSPREMSAAAAEDKAVDFGRGVSTKASPIDKPKGPKEKDGTKQKRSSATTTTSTVVVPCPDLPGWTVKTVTRVTGGGSKRRDRYWTSPDGTVINSWKKVLLHVADVGGGKGEEEDGEGWGNNYNDAAPAPSPAPKQDAATVSVHRPKADTSNSTRALAAEAAQSPTDEQRSKCKRIVGKEMLLLRDQLSPDDITSAPGEPRGRRQRKTPKLFDPGDGDGYGPEERERQSHRYKKPAVEEEVVVDEDTKPGKKGDVGTGMDRRSNSGVNKRMREPVTITGKEKGSVPTVATSPKNVACYFCYDAASVPVCCFCACRVCFSKGSAESTLLCDSCDSEYHTFCLTPPLKALPKDDEDWFCPTCVNAQAKKAKAAADRKARRAANKSSKRVATPGSGSKRAQKSKAITPARASPGDAVASKAPTLSTPAASTTPRTRKKARTSASGRSGTPVSCAASDGATISRKNMTAEAPTIARQPLNKGGTSRTAISVRGISSKVPAASPFDGPTCDATSKPPAVAPQKSRSGRTVKRSSFFDEVHDGEQRLSSSSSFYSAVKTGAVKNTGRECANSSNVSGPLPACTAVVPSVSKHSVPRNTASQIAADISEGPSVPLHVCPVQPPTIPPNTSAATKKLKLSPPGLNVSIPQLPSTAASLGVATTPSGSGPPMHAPFTPGAYYEHNTDQSMRSPRRKPGARECMQMSRRFGVTVIPQKYMDTLLDYRTRGKVEHLIRMRARLDDHSRFLEMKIAELEVLVKQKGELPSEGSAGTVAAEGTGSAHGVVVTTKDVPARKQA